MKRFLCALSIGVLGSIAAVSAQGAKRPISLDDLGRLKEVRDPQCAPDGKSVAFVVSQIDVKEDKAGNGHIWMVGIDGQNERQITFEHRQRVVAEFESRRQVSVLHVVPSRQSQRAISCGCWIAAAARPFS